MPYNKGKQTPTTHTWHGRGLTTSLDIYYGIRTQAVMLIARAGGFFSLPYNTQAIALPHVVVFCALNEPKENM